MYNNIKTLEIIHQRRAKLDGARGDPSLRHKPYQDRMEVVRMRGDMMNVSIILRGHNWVHFAHRLSCTVTVNSDFATL